LPCIHCRSWRPKKTGIIISFSKSTCGDNRWTPQTFKPLVSWFGRNPPSVLQQNCMAKGQQRTWENKTWWNKLLSWNVTSRSKSGGSSWIRVVSCLIENDEFNPCSMLNLRDILHKHNCLYLLTYYVVYNTRQLTCLDNLQL
jgi:hypothetical protein